MRQEDQERIRTEVRSRVTHSRVERAAAQGQPIDEILAESIYHERRRLKDVPASPHAAADRAFWEGVARRFQGASEARQREIISDVVEHYCNEVCGNFDPRVYGVATRLLPPALGLLLNASSPRRLLSHPTQLPGIDQAITVQGDLEQLRRLHELGTVILAPTHVSNLDSLVLGYSIYQMGLPPFIYGAGLNLFTQPLLGFFMHNLGAYTVDRQKRDPLYKDVLKSYASATLEMGYDNLFFPGGTRSRSGAIEKRLKLGLVGAGLQAYINNLHRGRPQPKIFVVPATLSFQLVLEAETLIDDFLEEVGKARYIITDDEFSKPRRIYDFITQLFGMDSKIFLTIGRGMDPFGNPVDEDGESLDPRGRAIDISRYVLVDGEPRALEERDAEYTEEVGERLLHAYLRDNVVQSTHLTARVMFTLLRRHNPNIDIMRLLRAGGRHNDFDIRELYGEMDRCLSQLRQLAERGAIRLAQPVANGRADDIVADGLRHFAVYHVNPAARRRGDRVFADDRSLLFYYQNRLEGYRLEREMGLSPALSEDHRALGAAA